MQAIQKAQARVAAARQSVPRIMQAPYSGVSYFGASYHYEQILHLRFWLGVGIRAWQREVSGGDAPKLGEIHNADQGEQKVLLKCKSFGLDTKHELYNHRVKQAKIRRKASSGPKDHEEFTAWDYDHPIVELFRVPNALDCATDLWGFTVLFYLLTGEAHWWILRNSNGVPVEVWVVPTHWMRLVTGPDGMPSAWAVQSPWGTLQYIPYDDVLSFRDLSPLNRYEGYGTTLLMNEWIDAYECNVRARLSQYKNGAIPAFHVALSDEYVDPDEAMLNRYYSKWFARFQGENNTGKPLITGPGVEINSLGISPVDMQYKETEDQFRDMILSALGVPKGVVGLEPSSDVSAYAPQRQFLRFAVNPFLGMLGERITHGLIRRTPHCDRGVCFWDDRVIDDPEQIRADLTARWEKGMLSPNQGLAMLGQEPWPSGGDNPWINGVEMPWKEPEQGASSGLDESVDRAERGQIEMDLNHPTYHGPVDGADDDSPLIIDKDEDEPVKAEPKLRWFRTRDGDLSCRGESGKWYIERKRRKDGKVGYILHHTKPQDKQQYEYDADLACGVLKDLAEREESKALGGDTGAAGGYAIPTESVVVKPTVDKASPRYMTERERQAHNDEVWQITNRTDRLLGRNMVYGNGTGTDK